MWGTLPVRGDTSVQSFPPPRLPCAGRTAAGAPGAHAPRPAAPSGSHPANPSERSGASDFHLPAVTKKTKCCHWMTLVSRLIFRRKNDCMSTARKCKCLSKLLHEKTKNSNAFSVYSLPRGVVESLSLKVFKRHEDVALRDTD